MKVLAIDTSNYVMGVALIDGEEVKAEIITNVKKNHSGRVMAAIEFLFGECDMTPSELDLVVVAKGPGSYTGVRIGVTIAKTMSWSLKIPIVGVSSLEVLAYNGRHFKGYISPLFDGRRGQIYTGLYESINHDVKVVEKDIILQSKTWANTIKKHEKPILFLGNDLHIHKEILLAELGDLAVFASPVLHNPRPSELAFIGMGKKFEIPHNLVPNYMRLAEAEAKWLEQQKG